MYLLGHVGLALLIYFIIERINGEISNRNKLMIAIGAMLPDFLDKSIGSFVFNYGRWLGHNIFFQLIVLIVLSLVWTYKKPYLDFKNDKNLLYVGSVIHLIGDLPSIGLETLLWPLFGPFPQTESISFLYGFQSPITIISELLGLIVIISIGITDKWNKEQWAFVILSIIVYMILYLIFLVIFVL